MIKLIKSFFEMGIGSLRSTHVKETGIMDQLSPPNNEDFCLLCGSHLDHNGQCFKCDGGYLFTNKYSRLSKIDEMEDFDEMGKIDETGSVGSFGDRF